MNKKPSSLNEVLKSVYDDEWPYKHTHVYNKTLTTDILEPIYASEEDRQYDLDYPGRWQGSTRKIGEKKFIVCNICDKTEDKVNSLHTFWSGIDKIYTRKKYK